MLTVILTSHLIRGHTGVSRGGVGALGTLQEEQLGESREACFFLAPGLHVCTLPDMCRYGNRSVAGYAQARN